MCTRDTTCEYFGSCECGGCPCNDVTCYSFAPIYDRVEQDVLACINIGIDDAFAMASVERMKFHPWRFRETFKGAVNRRRPNPRRRIRNFIQKYYFFARDVSDTASFRQRYSLVRKFQ